MDKLDTLKVRSEKRQKTKKKKMEFSKLLLIQETILIWIMTLGILALAFVCVVRQSYGELPWLTAMIGFPWGAYGISQAYYYNKAKAENTKNGIKYETVMNEMKSDSNSAVG